MYGFVEKNGKTYLDTADGLIDLEENQKNSWSFEKNNI
ncbi:hypothetical protein ES708_03644 [subsurface metagenome]